MEVYCNGTARIKHRETREIHEIDGDMLDWSIVGSDERQMGAEFHYEAVIEHPELGKMTWGLWEYPVGAENYRETNVGPHEVVEDLDYGLEHTQDDSDEWLDPAPPPQATLERQELEATGRAGAQGRATLSVSFADKEAVLEWLNGQPEDAVVAFAARAALRVLPTMRFGSVGGPVRLATRAPVLRAFRAVATAWAVAAYPQARTDLNNAARDALSGLGDIRAQPPIRAAVYAAATAAGAGNVAIQHAATVIGYALDAAAAGGRDPFQSLLHALAVDAGLLSGRYSPVTIANSQLWPGKYVPVSIGDAWMELRDGLLAANEKWEVWTNWYEQRLDGDTPDPNLEIAKVILDHDFWEQDPNEVNARLNEMIEEREIFNSALEKEPETAPDIADIPRQTSAASQFFVNTQGELDLLPNPPMVDDAQQEFYQEVRYKALALSGLGHNQLAELTEPVSRFLATAPEHYEDVSITRLWSRGNTLRQRLKAHDATVEATDPTDPAILPKLVAETLRDLVESYNIFIFGDPSGRELDQIRLGPQERELAEVIVGLATPIAVAVQASIGVATSSAKETLGQQLDTARVAPSGLDGDQAVEVARRTLGNFIAELLRSAYARVQGESGFAWKEFRAGTYRYAGPALIAGGYVTPIIDFVASQAGNLRSFVEQVFHNPLLSQIIEAISLFAR
jgi:hypothetical protein